MLAIVSGFASSAAGPSAGLAIFTSPSTAARGAQLNGWLDQGGDAWCHIRLPTAHAADFDVTWDDDREGVDAPVRIRDKKTSELLFVVNKPWGRILLRDSSSGLGAAHKVACSAFHLRAIRCLAERCHPCVARSRWAAIFEDDVEFVPGRSPGTAAAFPHLLQRAALEAEQHGVNKVHLAVQRITRGARADWRPGAKADWRPGAKASFCAQLAALAPALLMWCTAKFSDSHAYLLSHAHAARIVGAWKSLLEFDGQGKKHAAVRCVDPWSAPAMPTMSDPVAPCRSLLCESTGSSATAESARLAPSPPHCPPRARARARAPVGLVGWASARRAAG
jgi:hypothetical protein